MRHKPINNKLFVQNRQRLAELMAPKSLAVLNANDVLPTNADGTLPMQPKADLFYQSGIEQEERSGRTTPRTQTTLNNFFI